MGGLSPLIPPPLYLLHWSAQMDWCLASGVQVGRGEAAGAVAQGQTAFWKLCHTSLIVKGAAVASVWPVTADCWWAAGLDEQQALLKSREKPSN